MFNEVILIGKLVDKPHLRETQQGIKMATMVLQVERPYRNNLGIRETDYINCILWRSIINATINTYKNDHIKMYKMNYI